MYVIISACRYKTSNVKDERERERETKKEREIEREKKIRFLQV
jgi:hypothetical protein